MGEYELWLNMNLGEHTDRQRHRHTSIPWLSLDLQSSQGTIQPRTFTNWNMIVLQKLKRRMLKCWKVVAGWDKRSNTQNVFKKSCKIKLTFGCFHVDKEFALFFFSLCQAWWCMLIVIVFNFSKIIYGVCL